MAAVCRSLPLELSHPESAVGRKEPLISDLRMAALENLLPTVGGEPKISKTLTR